MKVMHSKSPHFKPKNIRRTFIRLFSYINRYYRLQFIFVLLAIFISALVNILGTFFISVLIDNYLEPNIGNPYYDYSSLALAILVMAGIYLVGVLSQYLINRLMLNINQGILRMIRDELFAHLEKLPIAYFDSQTHGDLMSRFTNDIDTLRQMISQSIPQLILSAVMIVGTFVSMLILSPLLTVLVIVMLFVMITVVRRIGGKSAQNFIRRQQAIGRINGFIEEMIEGQKVVKVFCHEEKAKADFDKINQNLYEVSTKADTYANILMPIMGNIGYFNYAITAMVGGILAIYNITNLTLGQIGSFLEFTRRFSRPITTVSQQFNSIIMALAGAERIFEVLDQVPETDEGRVRLVYARINEQGELEETGERTGIWAWKQPQEDGTDILTQVKGNVVFNNVNFGYTKETAVLQNISLYARPGQKIAFVGSTGAGKTTITNLINRFYDIQEGEILYDGINIKDIRKSDLRRSLAMVLQDTHLFTGTVRDNIRYGRLDATDEEVYQAAKLANADYFISHLPEGYDTMLTNDGENLSQGQRQLLAIARAAVADPPVLILDEATSSVDTRTEKLIEKGMDKLMEGRTVFVIAHRLSTVRNSQAIMVLEHGHIIERGNHEDLLLQKGKYYQFYTGLYELN
jgi:ATP-binding cassette subfamily B multidrug efflux pump